MPRDGTRLPIGGRQPFHGRRASLHGDTALGRPVGDSGVVAFGRDLTVSYRVWSPKSGYRVTPPTATSTP